MDPPRPPKPRFIIGRRADAKKPSAAEDTTAKGSSVTMERPPELRQPPRFTAGKTRPPAPPFQGREGISPQHTVEAQEQRSNAVDRPYLAQTSQHVLPPSSRFQGTTQAKRRRLSDEGAPTDTSTIDQPSNTRFLPSQASSVIQDSPASKPTFLRSSTNVGDPRDPLPEVFSPHRRGKRFVPGGMAAEVQTWILDIGNAARQDRQGRENGYGKVVEVQSVIGDDVQFVCGSTRQRQTLQLLLVEQGSTATGQPVKVRVGDLVGVRDPTWPMELREEKVTVAADWQILK